MSAASLGAFSMAIESCSTIAAVRSRARARAGPIGRPRPSSSVTTLGSALESTLFTWWRSACPHPSTSGAASAARPGRLWMAHTSSAARGSPSASGSIPLATSAFVSGCRASAGGGELSGCASASATSSDDAPCSTIDSR